MKSLLIPISLLLSSFSLALEPGDKVTVDALKEAEFFKGEAPTEWEKGKVYILECWATWCGPCIQIIPHVDELYDTYNEKGLEIIGMNVWEREKEKASEFVKEKGDDMSYAVAHVEKGGEFEAEWLKKAGVNGIPHAFVIKDGVLLMGTHPGALTNEKVEELLGDGLDVDQFVMNAKEEKKQADTARDRVKQVQGLVGKKDWDGLITLLSDIPESDKVVALQTSVMVDASDDVKPELLKLLVGKLSGPNSVIFKSRLYTKLGDKENAIKYAEEAKKEISESVGAQTGKADILDKPLDLYIQKIKDDEPMSFMQLQQEIMNVMKAQEVSE